MVCVNAEGNIVKGTDRNGIYRAGALYILFLMYFSKRYLNKYCAVINHTVDPHNRDAEHIINKVYSCLDFIAVREPYSLSVLKRIGIRKKINIVPDALFTYSPMSKWKPSKLLIKEIDFSRQYICIGDSSGIFPEVNRVKWDVYNVYRRLVSELKGICSQIIFIDGFNGGKSEINKLIYKMRLGRVNLSNCSYEDLWYVLANARIFISGRYHASILSSLSGTPILLWGADSHKTEGLYAILDYPYKFFDIDTLPIHLDEVVEETARILLREGEVRSYLLNKTKELREASYGNCAFVDNIT